MGKKTKTKQKCIFKYNAFFKNTLLTHSDSKNKKASKRIIYRLINQSMILFFIHIVGTDYLPDFGFVFFQCDGIMIRHSLRI